MPNVALRQYVRRKPVCGRRWLSHAERRILPSGAQRGRSSRPSPHLTAFAFARCQIRFARSLAAGAASSRRCNSRPSMSSARVQRGSTIELPTAPTGADGAAGGAAAALAIPSAVASAPGASCSLAKRSSSSGREGVQAGADLREREALGEPALNGEHAQQVLALVAVAEPLKGVAGKTPRCR